MNKNGHGIVLTTSAGDVLARQVVNCAGLHCDRVTAMSGEKPGAENRASSRRIFRAQAGGSSLLQEPGFTPCRTPNSTFLGVHFTTRDQW